MSSEIISESAHVLDMSHFGNKNVAHNTHTASPLCKLLWITVFYLRGMKTIKYVIYVYLEGTIH
jgi:hypothetical protein